MLVEKTQGVSMSLKHGCFTYAMLIEKGIIFAFILQSLSKLLTYDPYLNYSQKLTIPKKILNPPQ